MEDINEFKDAVIKEIVKLEQQVYVLYLQLNTVCRYLAEQQLLDPDKMITDMRQLNEDLWAADDKFSAETEGITPPPAMQGDMAEGQK